MPKFSIVFAALLCLVACKSQENYVLETKTAFFLMQDDSLHQKNLIALSKNGNFHNQLHQSLGIAASDLGDLVGKDNQCWVYYSLFTIL